MIYVHGLYRSGTNYVRQLLVENVAEPVREDSNYNVHYRRKRRPENSKYVVVYKTFDQWLDSIARICYDLEAYEDVLYEEDHTPFPSNSAIPKNPHKTWPVVLSAEKLLDVYVEWCKHWKELDQKFWLFNDILRDPHGFLKETGFELKPHPPTVKFNEVQSSKPVTDRLHKQYVEGSPRLFNTHESLVQNLHEAISLKSIFLPPQPGLLSEV